MKIYRILSLFFIALSFASCIKDKGNYDYVKHNELWASFTQTRFTVNYGETLEIVPIVRYYDTNILEKPDLNYEWIVDDGAVVSTEPTYTFVAGNIIKETKLTLVIEDKVSKLKFATDCNISTESAYKSGYLILHEDEAGNSDISMISTFKGKGLQDDKGKANDSLYYKAEYKNIYSSVNGVPMGKNGVSITEHAALNTNSSVVTEVTIITENGNRMEDLHGLSFKKETSIEDEFSDGMPDNYRTKKALHACWDSYLVDYNGRMFTRRNALSDAYHTSTFSKKSTYNGDVKYDNIFFTYYINNDGLLALEFDEAGKRNFIGISCALYSGDQQNGARMPVIPAEGNESLMSEVTDVKGEFLFDDYCITPFVDGYSDNIGHYFVVKENDKFFLRYYEFYIINRRGNIELLAAEKVDLSQFTGGKDVLGMSSCKAESYDYEYNIVYFHDGSKVYAYNFDTNVCSVLFDGKGKVINAFDAYTKVPYFYNATSVKPSLCVAFSDGSIEVYEIKKENLMSVIETKLLFKTQNNYGKVKQILYKYGNSADFLNY